MMFLHNRWNFYNPVSLYVGRGCRQELTKHLHGQKILIVATKRGHKQFEEDEFLMPIVDNNFVTWMNSVQENPDLDDLQYEINRLSGLFFDAVLAFGGGSALDTAKVINVALTSECANKSLRELIQFSEFQKNLRPSPLYTIPTTSGTGSEVSPFATVWDHKNKKKLSLAGPAVWAKVAFVDAALTDSLPLGSTISTGLDAINQAAESIWNNNANGITLGYATRALILGFTALPLLASGQGGQRERDQMAEASLLAGLAISHTRTALCHSISYPLTAHFAIPHGLACAFTMPAVLRHNLQAEDGRFAEVALALTGSRDLDGLVESFDRLNESLQVVSRVKEKIPSLDALLALKAEMFTPGRADNNLALVENLQDILKSSWAAK